MHPGYPAGMRARSILARSLAAIAASAVLAACIGTSSAPLPAPSPTAMGPRVDRCGVGLVEADPNRGLSSVPLDPAPGELLVDALLVEDASGASIEGRPLAYAGRLRGDVPVVHAGSGQAVFEAQRNRPDAIPSSSSTGEVDCQGAIRILLASDVLADNTSSPYPAMVSASLAGAEVLGGLWSSNLMCSAVRGADQSIALECSLAAVRRGATVTSGILRARLAWSGTPAAATDLPDWAAGLLAGMSTPGPIATRMPMTWAVSADHPSFIDDPGGPAGGSVTIGPEAGTTRYDLLLAIVHRPDLADARERKGMLSVAISEYAGPGVYPADVITGEVTLRGDGTWAEPGDRHYALTACTATLGAGSGAENRLECGIGAWPGGGQSGAETGHLSATWSIESLPAEVGQTVLVTWQYNRSGGSASVTRAAPRPGIYDVPEVRIGGTPAEPQVLRIWVMPFIGDGTYVGGSITAVVDGVNPSPLIDHCVATITGADGTIECLGVLAASWRTLP